MHIRLIRSYAPKHSASFPSCRTVIAPVAAVLCHSRGPAQCMHLRPCLYWFSDCLRNTDFFGKRDLPQMKDSLWPEQSASPPHLSAEHDYCTCVNSFEAAAFVLTALDITSTIDARIKARTLHLSLFQRTIIFTTIQLLCWDEDTTLRTTRSLCYH